MFIPVYILAMFCGGGILALCVSVYFDACRDARVPTRDDWPHSGLRIMRKGLRFSTSVQEYENERLEKLGYRLFYTIDRTHVQKWMSVYPVWIWIWFSVVGLSMCVDMWLGIFMAILLPIICQALWHLVEKPWNEQ